jgi:acyl-coenzyme A thioesterase PaaI-like protein
VSPRERHQATRLTAAEISAFLDEVFPGAMDHFVIEDVRPMRARVRMLFNEFRLRPGGTISGPSLMTLADGVWRYYSRHGHHEAKCRHLLPYL